jgi:hypothetical protein
MGLFLANTSAIAFAVAKLGCEKLRTQTIVPLGVFSPEWMGTKAMVGPGFSLFPAGLKAL